MLTLFIKLIKALNSNSSNSQLSAAFILGMFLGLTPLLSAHNLVILLFILLFNVNISASLLSWGVFSLLALLMDPAMIELGHYMLNNEALTSLWTHWYASDLLRIAHFNNTLTLGSFITCCLLTIPLFFIFQILIKTYRNSIQGFVEKSKLAQLLKGSRLYQMYQG